MNRNSVFYLDLEDSLELPQKQQAKIMHHSREVVWTYRWAVDIQELVFVLPLSSFSSPSPSGTPLTYKTLLHLQNENGKS
jgi:hypothetical protein